MNETLKIGGIYQLTEDIEVCRLSDLSVDVDICEYFTLNKGYNVTVLYHHIEVLPKEYEINGVYYCHSFRLLYDAQIWYTDFCSKSPRMIEING